MKMIKTFCWMFVGLAMIIPGRASAKELYLTVRRDFAIQEKPVVEMAFQNPQPVQFRIYAPKDQKAFISSQMDLRRAWRKPKTAFNPFHFLAKGQNDLVFETDWLRRGVRSDLREELQGQLGGGKSAEGSSPWNPGAEKIIFGPDQFELVTEMVVHPEAEDKDKPFDVPGFWATTSYGVKTKWIQLPQLQPGFYLVQVVQGELEGQVLVVVNDLLVQFEQSSGEGHFRVVDRVGRPVAGARIQGRSLSGKWIFDGKTNPQGEWTVKALKETDLVTQVEAAGKGSAIMDSSFYSTQAVYPDLYLYTDRPMYRKGDPVYFRGILREMAAGTSLVPKKSVGKVVRVKVENLKGGRVSKVRDFKVSEFGTFTGEMKLDAKDLEEGLYRISAEMGKEGHVAEFRLKDYVKPTFFATLRTQQESASLGQTVSGDVKVERYSGGVPRGVKGNVQIFRTRFQTPGFVKDAGLAETGSTVTYGFDAGEEAASEAPLLVAEMPLEFNFRGLAEFALDIPEELPGAASFDYQYQVRVSVQDEDQRYATTSKNLFDFKSEVKVLARFDAAFRAEGEEAALNVRSQTPKGDVFPKARGRVQVKLVTPSGELRNKASFAFETNNKGFASFPVRLDQPGEWIAEVQIFDKKDRMSTAEGRLIAGDPKSQTALQVVKNARFITNQEEVDVGAEVRGVLLLPQGWGVEGKNTGLVHLTWVGRSVFGRESLQVNGNTLWITKAVKKEFGTLLGLQISYLDPRQGWVEKRASFRVRDPSTTLQLRLLAKNAKSMPGAKQTVEFRVLDLKGMPIQSEISVAVVDRSVLDLQPELRPSLTEFFYPMDRMNLASFVSSEFQSYGYGEKLAGLFRPNHSLAASKSATQALEEKDTAFWRGRVVTNAKGEAQVSFDLPANQSIWKVIAVAVDKKGRFGEGKTEFQSKMPVSFILGAPNFLRRGDEPVIRLNLTNNEKNTVATKFVVRSEEGLKFAGPLSVETKIKGGGQDKASQTALVVDNAPDRIELLSKFEFGGRPLNFRNSVRVEDRAVTYPEYQRPLGGTYRLARAAGESFESVRVQIPEGLIGSLVPTMRWMIQYHYGCVEQTISTTLPNLVFAGLLRIAENRKIPLSAVEKEMLTNAESFGRAGVERLGTFRKADGSYTWFAGQGDGDENMTYFVLLSLASASSAPVDWSPFVQSLEWLEAKRPESLSSRAYALTYLKSLFHAKYAKRDYNSANLPTLVLQAEHVLKNGGSRLEKAWLLMAATRFAYRDKKAQELKKQLLAQLTKEMGDGGGAPAPKGPNPPGHLASWTALPGAEEVSWAVAGDAIFAATEGKDVKVWRNLFRARALAQFNGENFGSTFESALILMHSRWILESEINDLRGGRSRSLAFTLNGGAIQPAHMKVETYLGGQQVEVSPALFSVGSHELRLPSEYTKESPPLVIRHKVDFLKLESKAAGFAMQKAFYRIGEKGEKTLFDPRTDKLKNGELVYLNLQLRRTPTPGPFTQGAYYVLNEYLPAGLVTVEDDEIYEAAPFGLRLRGAAKSRELGSDRVRFYFDFSQGWMDQPQEVGVMLRAQFPGRYAGGATQISDFYDDTRFAVAPGSEFIITP